MPDERHSCLSRICCLMNTITQEFFSCQTLFYCKKTPFDNSVTVQPYEDSDRKKVESSPVSTCVNQIYDHGEPFYGKEKALYRDGWVQGAFFFRN